MVLAFFFVLIIFLWQYNLKPLFINAQINKAENMACAKKLPALEKAFSQKSFLDSYLRLFYVEETKKCLEENSLTSINYMQKGIEALKYVSKVRPLYTRTWILLGSFKTILFANETNPEAKQNLFKEANSDFERALSLGPKHQETLAEWAKLYFAAEDYAKMKELSEKCVSLNPDTNTCYWYLGLAEIALSDKEKGEEHLKTAREKRFPYETGAAYSQLAIVYTKTQNYQKLVSVYESLMSLDPKNIQYYATLAAVYKEMGNYKMAKETALKILDIAPEAKDEVNEFLKTLP
jgi:tetratricopeptide (TPR) repeat protein